MDSYTADTYGCGNSKQSFDCSREAVEKLRLNLDLWKLSRDSYERLEKYLCSKESNTCSYSSAGRLDWVSGLSFNTSDPEQAEAKRYLECVA